MTERRAISPETLFRTGLDTLDYGFGRAGLQVTADTALNYSGFWACVRLLASDISTLPVGAFRQTGDTREPLTPRPLWLESPDPFDPSTTAIDHFAQVAISLLLDGNAFIRVKPSVFEPRQLEVLNPRRVVVKRPGDSPEYHFVNAHGVESDVSLTPAEILHVKINRKPGALRGMSPVDANQSSIGISLAAQKYVETFFGQGNMAPGYIEVPIGSKDSIDQMRSEMTKQHGGWRRSGLLGFLTGGATFKATGVSPKDAQLTDIFKQQLQEAASIFGIPPFMVGSQEASGVAYASAVARSQDYIDHCLRHYVLPIEKAYKRLVPGDRRLASPGADTFIKFNFDALLRGDTKSRFEAYQTALNGRFMKIDQVRAYEDWAPFGEDAGGGFLNTPNNVAQDPRIAEVSNLVEWGFEPEAAVAAVGLPPIAHTGLVSIKVQGENVATTAPSPGGTAP